MILLDTCTLLWLENPEQLSHAAKKAISRHAGLLYVSAISAFEMAIKQRCGKLILPFPAGQCYQKFLTLHGIHELPVTGEIASHSATLPLIHKDPCDRMIIATAQLHELSIVTADQTIPRYEDVSILW